jgi:glycosyltransferase involved in cell wall biosynthesis
MNKGGLSHAICDRRLEERPLNSGKPFVSVVVPGYNEAAIVGENLERLYEYMESLEDQYEWELIIVDDGSTDATGKIADAFAATRPMVRVLHHFTNFNVGQALRFAFNQCKGDYVVTMDMDLSYSPEHIGKLLETISKRKAKIVVASPYMPGGRTANVPWLRMILSKLANKFLSYTAKGGLSTLTSMVRAYDRPFLCSLSLRSMDVAINAEILYKAMLLHARILEIPAVLNWNPKEDPKFHRKSSFKIRKSIIAYLLSGFIFRPFIFFILPGFGLTILALFSFFWAFIHVFDHLMKLPVGLGSLGIRLSAAVSMAYQQAPHTFIIGGISLILSIQLVSLGILALQNKKYFEELFSLGTQIYKTKTHEED